MRFAKAKLLIIVLFMQMITACHNYNFKHVKLQDWLRPAGYRYGMMPYKPGDDVFNQAVRDACTTSGNAGGFSGEFSAAFYGFKRDERFAGVKYGDKRDLFNGREITEDDKDTYNWTWNRMYGICNHEFLGNMKNAGMFPGVSGQPKIVGAFDGGLQNGSAFSLGNIFYNNSVAPLTMW